MDIYESEGVRGVVDIEKATAALKANGAVRVDSIRRENAAEITAAALLDVARSLRVLAYEAELALPPMVSPETIAEVEATEDDFFVVGDLVAVEGSTEPGEIRGFGYDQDAPYADVAFANGEGAKVWLSLLRRLIGDDRDDDAMQAAAEASVEVVHGYVAPGGDAAAELADPHDAPAEDDERVAEIAHDLRLDDTAEPEDDFEPASALAALEAREAARKGKKKGSKK